MATCEQKRMEFGRRWLDMWRRSGKPRLRLDMGFSPSANDGYDGHLGSSGISMRFDGDPFAYDGEVLQAVRIFASGEDISVIVAELAALPTDGGRLVILFREEWWNALTVVGMAVQAAHCQAASATEDVEAMQALDGAVASEHVAALEAKLLADEARPAASGTRSNRRRL